MERELNRAGSPKLHARLIRDEADLTCCFVGVSFYKTLDGSMIFTSSAQVFNERGQGLIVRGSPAKIAKDDRDIHMTGEGATS